MACQWGYCIWKLNVHIPFTIIHTGTFANNDGVILCTLPRRKTACGWTGQVRARNKAAVLEAGLLDVERPIKASVKFCISDGSLCPSCASDCGKFTPVGTSGGRSSCRRSVSTWWSRSRSMTTETVWTPAVPGDSCQTLLSNVSIGC